jgi:hypothetical protein
MIEEGACEVLEMQVVKMESDSGWTRCLRR